MDYNATLVNGPTFVSDNGGILQFDGTNQGGFSSLQHCLFRHIYAFLW